MKLHRAPSVTDCDGGPDGELCPNDRQDRTTLAMSWRGEAPRYYGDRLPVQKGDWCLDEIDSCCGGCHRTVCLDCLVRALTEDEEGLKELMRRITDRIDNATLRSIVLDALGREDRAELRLEIKRWI